MKLRACLMAAALLLVPQAGQANDSEIRQAYSDEAGNAVIVTRSGAKMIIIGEGEGLPAKVVPNYGLPLSDSGLVVYDETPNTTPSRCYSSGAVVRGRSFMYGVTSGGPTPVISTVVCDD